MMRFLLALLTWGLLSAPAAAQMMLLGTGSAPSATITGTWNPANKSSKIDLSGGNLIATANGTATGFFSVKSTTSHSAGTFCYEFKDTVNTGAVVAGFGNASASLATLPGFDTAPLSVGWFDNGGAGNIYYNGSASGTNAAWTNNTWKMMCINLTVQKFWALDNAGLWNGGAIGSQNPNGNVGGVSFGATFGSYFAEMGLQTIGDSVTANFAGPFVNTLPTGYLAWGWILAPFYYRRRKSV